MAAIFCACNFQGGDRGLIHKVHNGLAAVQHRGEQEASVAVIEGNTLIWRKKTGLISKVFSTLELSGAPSVVLGRLSCSYPQRIFQPIINETTSGALVFEGQLAFSPKAILRDPAGGLNATIRYIKDFPGAYALVAGFAQRLIAFRDPRGIRPLVMGKDHELSYFFATESASIEAAGGQFVSIVEPGQIIEISPARIELSTAADWFAVRRCAIEVTSRMMLNSISEGQWVSLWREKLAERLAERFRRSVDGAIGIPRAGEWQMRKFAGVLGIPYLDAITYNRYFNWDHVLPEEPLRVKFGIIQENLQGVDTVALGDDLVRNGRTMRFMAGRLREAGVSEVHGVVFNPPLLEPCQYGVANWPKGGIVDQSDPDRFARDSGLDSCLFATPDDLKALLGDTICYYCAGGPKPLSFGSGVYQPPQSNRSV